MYDTAGRSALTDRAVEADEERAPVPMGFLAEFWLYLRERKKFWLLPIVIMMLLFGGLVILTKGTALAPFVYTLF